MMSSNPDAWKVKNQFEGDIGYHFQGISLKMTDKATYLHLSDLFIGMTSANWKNPKYCANPSEDKVPFEPSFFPSP